MNDRCLSAHGVEKDYPSGEGGLLRVLRGIDLTVENGSSICIVGPSGVGKSTLLHILGALEQPTRGEVRACGRAFFSLDDNRRSAMRNRLLGFVFQFHYLLAEFSAVENVAMPLLIRGVDSKQANEASSAILAEVGLAGRLHHRPAQLSGGEQQRVAVARALIHQPEFILADEPTGNLDTKTGEIVLETFQRLNAEEGRTVILITHERYVAEHANRIIHIRDGEIIEDEKNINRRTVNGM